MAISLICVGTELLTGETLNTNARFLAGRLDGEGIPVDAVVTIPDTPGAVAAAVTEALSRSRVVITIGGLGPTQDDLTKEAVAEALGQPLEHSAELAETIRSRYRTHARAVPESSWQKQALVPAAAEIIPNDYGTAAGLWCRQGDRVVAMLPGPPREFEPMVDEQLLGRVRELLPRQVARRSLAVFGLGESNTEKAVQAVLVDHPGVEPSYRARPGCCQVRLTAAVAEEQRVAQACAAVAEALGPRAAPGEVSLVDRVCDLVSARGGLFGTAESCTGGLIAGAVTDKAGVPGVFAGGVVSYSNELKMQLLGVSAATLAAHGAVSEAVAREMVVGLVARYGLLAGVAVTGIAGPAGGTPAKPVGTVHLASAVGDDVRHLHRCFPYGRRGMRERTVIAALALLHEHLSEAG